MFEQTIYLVAALATIGAFLFEVWWLLLMIKIYFSSQS